MAIKTYTERITAILTSIEEKQSDNLKKAAELFVECVKNDNLIHVFGTGHSHMMGIEMFVRAGGLANVNAMLDCTITTADGAQKGGDVEKLEGLAEIIWNNYDIKQDDIMIIVSNSGRNAVPVEMAMKAKEEGLKLIVITALEQSRNTTSRHASGKKLYEFADIVLDNSVPPGDSLMSFGDVKSGPGSTISGCFIVNCILVETLEMLHEQNIALPVFGSQNVDGFDNDSLYAKYKSRIKHM
jgi:uncharacterized phosphosugar-binding protein